MSRGRGTGTRSGSPPRREGRTRWWATGTTTTRWTSVPTCVSRCGRGTCGTRCTTRRTCPSTSGIGRTRPSPMNQVTWFMRRAREGFGLQVSGHRERVPGRGDRARADARVADCSLPSCENVSWVANPHAGRQGLPRPGACQGRGGPVRGVEGEGSPGNGGPGPLGSGTRRRVAGVDAPGLGPDQEGIEVTEGLHGHKTPHGFVLDGDQYDLDAVKRVVDKLNRDNPGHEFLQIETSMRLVEAGIEVSLRLGNNTAQVIIDPTDDPMKSYSFMQNLPDAIMETINRAMAKMEASDGG